MIAAALAMSACSTEDKSSSSTTTASPTSAADQSGTDEGGAMTEAPDKTGAAPTTRTSPQPATPTVAELNKRLNDAFDPSVDSKDKIKWLQAGEQDPYLVDKLVEAAKKNNVTIEVVKVNEPVDGKLTAEANVSVAGQPKPTIIEFISEGGEWKITQTFTCNIVKAAQLQSAACE
jgi:hypothetical protein